MKKCGLALTALGFLCLFAALLLMVLFMDFAVFNVADICVVCGGIAFCVYFCFFYERLEKRGKAPEAAGEASHGPADPDR